jgi:hypothetical protein
MQSRQAEYALFNFYHDAVHRWNLVSVWCEPRT